MTKERETESEIGRDKQDQGGGGRTMAISSRYVFLSFCFSFQAIELAIRRYEAVISELAGWLTIRMRGDNMDGT